MKNIFIEIKYFVYEIILLIYFLLFIPVTIIIYILTPKEVKAHWRKIINVGKIILWFKSIEKDEI
jgi:hypothetical protein